MEISNGYLNKSHHNASFAASSQRDVTYRCGSCGYDLNLSSSARNTATIGSKYGKSIKTGKISFFSIDESRFTQVEEFKCVPYFISKHFWGLFRRKTKLMCRKCNNHIGNAYDDTTSSYPLVADGSDSASGSEVSSYRKYDVRIRAVQPSSSMEAGLSLVM
ncbi:unnamed protein product [Lactuca saligna]|uniref:Uncharacterized protein n=1 Tax=Lactuca saligna TaxID=75948 RepID=A0AA35UXX5_LACSI|nr:unnamed protein product [Lactuca saligna]